MVVDATYRWRLAIVGGSDAASPKPRPKTLPLLRRERVTTTIGAVDANARGALARHDDGLHLASDRVLERGHLLERLARDLGDELFELRDETTERRGRRESERTACISSESLFFESRRAVAVTRERRPNSARSNKRAPVRLQPASRPGFIRCSWWVKRQAPLCAMTFTPMRSAARRPMRAAGGEADGLRHR